ncbi:MAG: hypothetical protein AB7S90_08915 [Marinobacterium sp.]|uniref:Uncharacterized protein n=1 Tax=Marinobacterium iners DSM 11526 TaxID=1122198 RepID=A0A1H4EFG9_9GAMM|nr:hypothetical protein [Marinobacterium iners]SEA83587.1 hypothetical protein SAMN02745729_10856 [Marinobacterium iners DSM 11526]
MLSYRISTRYYRTQTARHLLWMLGLVIAVVISIYYLFQASAVADFLVPALGVAACSAYFIKLFQHVRHGRSAYPEIELDNQAKTLTLVQGDNRIKVDISHILDLRLKYRSYHLEQIQMTTQEGEVLRLEGYDELEDLGAELELLTPSHNVKRSKIRIR